MSDRETHLVGSLPRSTAAEAMATVMGGNPGARHACAVTVPVEENWWHRSEPVAVVCSVHAA